MAYDFPDTPTIGQVYQGYTWDGEKWQVQGSATFGAVRFDLPQGLTANQQVQGRQNIYAAPFDALSYSGMQINGSMDVSQALGFSVPVSTTAYVCDGWLLFKTAATATVNASVNNTNPLVFSVIPNYLLIVATTAQASMAAGESIFILAPIEGYRMSRLAWGTPNAQPITIGFWASHNRTGTYSGAVVNGGAGNRSYPFTYTQNVAAAAEYKTVTIPGCTDGTWAIDNTTGMAISFMMAGGSNSLGPAGAWANTLYRGATGQINAVAATSDFFRITGVVVLPGIEAPSAARAPLIMRPYDQELLTCKRYFYNGAPPLKGVTNGLGTAVTRLGCSHPVQMRGIPALVFVAPLPVYDGTTTATISAATTSTSTVTVLELDATTSVTLAANRPAFVYQGAGGNLNVDARL